MHILSSSFKLFGLSFLFIAFFGTTSNAQTLSISSNGQTGTSGTNWSTTGSNPVIITATNTTDINTSVIEGYLNQGLSVEIRNTASPGKIQIEAPITKSAGGDATLTIRANGRVFVWNGDHITSTSGKLNVVLWSDYNNDGDGGVSLTGNIITNGGHVWLGGSSSNGGSYTWNGLTVGDGPSVGASGANFNALDLYSNVTTSGGDFLAWAGDVTVAGSVTAGQPVPTKQSIQKTQATEPTRISITAQETVTLTETAMIQAQGNADSTAGQIRITAKDINTQGVLNTSGPVAGEVHLDALNTVQINGDISVDSTQGQGGLITAQAHTIHAQGDATLTATGKAGGGDILIGGDWQGGANEHRRVFDDPNALRQATIVTMDRGVLIDASVTQNGDGGTVVLWSDITNPNSVTSAHGTIYAKGGSQGGDGGQIETSGAKLITDGVSGSAAVQNIATGGEAGEWLFDPLNITIGDLGSAATSSNNGSDISANSIAHLLETGTSVVVTTYSGGSGDELGELIVASAITKASGNANVTLTLRAAHSIIISEDIKNTGGSGTLNLIFDADNDASSEVGSPIRNGAGIVILEADLFTAGGDVTFGSTVVNGYTGGNLYVRNDVSAVSVTTGSGNVTVNGQLVVVNSIGQGFTVSTSGGDIHLLGTVDSGNAFRRYAATDWFDALEHAEDMAAITGVNRWLATIDSSIENALAVRAAGYTDAWIGARRKDNTNLWQWVSDPAYDATTNPMTFFYQGTSTQNELGGSDSGNGGTTADGYYANWKNWTDGQTSGEPSKFFQSFGNANSNPVAAYLDANGKWIAESALWPINSYVQEFEKPASNLMLDAGAGAVNIDGAIGSAGALGVTDITGAAVTLSSSVALGSDKSLTVTNSGASSVAGAISGSGATVTKAGAGTLTLSGANSYTGATNIDAGVLKLGSAGSSDNTPLGTTAGATTIADGAALDLAGYTLANAEAITISGTGVSNSGAIYNSTGTAVTWSGATTLAANASIKSENGGALTWNGTINGAYALTLDTDGSSTDGAFTFGGGMGGSTPLTGLTITSGSANVTLNSAISIAGPITVYGSTITLDADLTTTTNSGDISLYTDNPLGGLSTARTIAASESFKYIPVGTSFTGAVTYPITNLTVTSVGLTIGKTSNTSDITLNTDLNLNTIALFGGTIALNHNIDCSSLEIEGTATLAKGKYIDATGNLVNNGTLILDSDSNEFSRMMVGSTVSGSGTYKYQKYVAGSSTNDLITAPFSGETFSNLVNNNSGVLVTNPSDATQYLFGPFDNDTGEYLTYDYTTNELTVLSAGQGYRAGTASGATLEFTGTFQTTDQTVAINVGEHETYGKWNLVGNPFPSYLDLDGFLDDNNTGVLENVNTAVYAYDGDDSNGGSNWTIYSLNETSNVKIAPGQAFFVASSSGVGNLVFNTSRQTVTGGDDFLQRQTQTLDSFFKLKLQSNNSLTHTDFYFNSNAGEGLDIGYDVGTYANLASSFSLYSKLASGEYSETNFAIQAISNDLSETVVIPLGVHTSAGENHSISIEDVSILESINVYLKDYETGTLTLLNNGAYSFSTDSNLEGISRFELRLANTTLGIESDELITNFKAVYQNGGVVLVGDFMLDDKVEIFDIMGRLTQTHTIKGNHSIEITKEELANGVYLAKINRKGNIKTIKFIIN